MTIDLTELRRDPERLLERLGTTAGSDVTDEIRTRVTLWTEQRRKVAALRRAKQEVAAAFRTRPAEPAAIEGLKARMTEVSGALVDAEAVLKRLERELTQQAVDATKHEPSAASIPERFVLRAPSGNAPGALTFEPLSAANRAEWDSFVDAQPRACLYHYSRWERWVTGALRQHSMCLLARSGTAVVGVLPLYLLRSRFFGKFVVSIPYLNYGGPLGVNSGVETALLARASHEAASLGVTHMEVRETAQRDGWPVRTDKVSMLRALPSSLGALEAQLGAKLRSQVRRAAREGFTFRRGTDDALLRDFYCVFARNMRDLGTPVYAQRVFEELLELCPENATILVGYVGRRPAGAAFLLRHRDTLEIPWASTLREHDGASLNMQLYWQVLGYAIEIGCRFFDFGRSTEGSGTFRFKKQWGAVPVRHYWHYWLRDGESLPALNPDNPKFRFLIECWKRLPLLVTKVLGPPIVRSLP